MNTNQVPDIGEMYKFYKLREAIWDELAYLIVQIEEEGLSETVAIEGAKDLKLKIESLGKNFNKENENGK